MDLCIYYVMVFFLVLLAVAFLTLLERKILSYSQLRKGPNKVSLVGLAQPFADGIKLFSKEELILFVSNKLFFVLSPFFSFFIAMLVWSVLFSFSGFLDFKYSVLFFICCVSVSVYGIILSGWSSNSKYAVLGALRAVAQTISYELNLSFLFFILALYLCSYSLSKGVMLSNYFIFLTMTFFFFFFLICVVETNRAPFDLAEGESELVSGFNVEYGGLKFSLIFLAEYGAILWMSLMLSHIFYFFIYFLLFMVLFILLRSSYPRYRYDFLMVLNWKVVLIFILLFYLLYLVIS